MSTTQEKTKGMVCIAGPFEPTHEEKTILGKMLVLYIEAGTRFYIEPRKHGSRKLLYLWRDKKGYATGERDPIAEGKKTEAQPPRGKRYASSVVQRQVKRREYDLARKEGAR